MGDTGAMALGGAIAAMAIMMKVELLLLFVGGIFAIVALSVMLQVLSFKWLGRRIFLIAPLQHHFEMKAWSETKIMVRFWIVTAILCARRLRALLQVLPEHPAALRALVYGLARSGRSAAERLGAGDDVVLVDRSLGNEDDLSLLDGVDVLVKSPGVPGEAPLVAAARERGDPGLVGGRARLPPAARARASSASPGTNGKTTTTELLGAIFRAAGRDVAVAGNVGTPLTSVARGGLGRLRALVASSSRTSHELACDVAVLLNLEPDHLDRHGSFEAYRDAKLRIFERARAQVVPRGLGLDGHRVLGRRRAARRAAAARRAQPRERRRGDRGRARGRDRATSTIAAALRTFPGVPHRLELVGERDGVRYVNDSKATNVAAALRGARRLRRRARAPDPRRLAEGRGLRAARRARSAPNVRSVHLIGDGGRAARSGARRPTRATATLERAVAHARRGSPSRATSCCSAPPARATTSSRTSRHRGRGASGALAAAEPRTR